MQKSIAMMVAAGCVISVLTGCGVPQEEHDAMIAQLNAEHQKEVEKLNAKVEEKASLLKSEQGKVRTARIELDEVSGKIDGLQKKAASAVKSLNSEKSKTSKLERDLASAKSKTMAAQDELAEIENSYAELKKTYAELKRRFDQFETNIRALNEPTPVAVDKAVEVIPQAEGESALDILNEMSAQ